MSQIAIERNSFIPIFNSDDVQSLDMTRNLNIENSSKQCLQKLSRTLLQPNELGYKNDSCIHQSLVCVVCDRFIIGTESFHWINVDTLKFHSNILSSSYFYKEGMNSILKSQYSIDHPQLRNLLLSPRARRDALQDAFMCCQCCFDDLYQQKRKICPPKFAISNGFAIGFFTRRDI
jgi:hypothetical protein